MLHNLSCIINYLDKKLNIIIDNSRAFYCITHVNHKCLKQKPSASTPNSKSSDMIIKQVSHDNYPWTIIRASDHEPLTLLAHHGSSPIPMHNG